MKIHFQPMDQEERSFHQCPDTGQDPLEQSRVELLDRDLDSPQTLGIEHHDTAMVFRKIVGRSKLAAPVHENPFCRIIGKPVSDGAFHEKWRSGEVGVRQEFDPVVFYFGGQGIGKNRRPLFNEDAPLPISTEQHDDGIPEISAGMEFSHLVLDAKIYQGDCCRNYFRNRTGFLRRRNGIPHCGQQKYHHHRTPAEAARGC